VDNWGGQKQRGKTTEHPRGSKKESNTLARNGWQKIAREVKKKKPEGLEEIPEQGKG